MTERRPAHETVPDFVERQIREAEERGDFDGLAGHGQPIPGLGQPHDELWWVKRKLRDEHVTDLPPALRARRDRDRALAEVAAARTEVEVRRLVQQVNQRIRSINRTAWYGPPTSVGPLDVEEVVATWRIANPDTPIDTPVPPAVPPAGGDQPTPTSRVRRATSWVGRRVRRRRGRPPAG